MKLTEDIRSITYLKRNAAKALDELNATGRPLVITQSGKTRAVIQDPESYERMVHALAAAWNLFPNVVGLFRS